MGVVLFAIVIYALAAIALWFIIKTAVERGGIDAMRRVDRDRQGGGA